MKIRCNKNSGGLCSRYFYKHNIRGDDMQECTDIKTNSVIATRNLNGIMHIEPCNIPVKLPNITNLSGISLRIGKDQYNAIYGRVEQITNGSEVLRNGIALITIEVTRDKAIEYTNSQLKQCFFDVECEPCYAERDGKQIDLNGQYYFGNFEPMKNGNYRVNIIQR